MKKIILGLLLPLLFLPLVASASLDTNLYYGMKNNLNVIDLQQFLSQKGFFSGEATGNFFGRTASSVQDYQASKGIIPTGFVGPITRKSINDEVALKASAIEPKPIDPKDSIVTQIQALQAQLNALNAQQTNTQQQVQQIQNNPPAPSPEPQAPAVSTPAPQVITPTIVENSDYTDQTIKPNTTQAKIGSFIITNPSNTDILSIGTFNVGLTLGSFQGTRIVGTPMQNFSVLKTSVTSQALSPDFSNTFSSSSYQIAPGQTANVDIFINSGPDAGANVTIQTTLSVAGVSATGQTITFK